MDLQNYFGYQSTALVPVTQKATLPVRLRPDELPASRAAAPMARASWGLHAYDTYSPWRRVPPQQNLKLYEDLSKAIPIIPGALSRLTQMVGCPRVDAEDDDTINDIHEWMDNILTVNRVGVGFDPWFSGWCRGHLLYGRAHAEVMPLRDYSDIWGLQTLHTRTIELRPARDGYGIDLVQRQQFGREVVLNPELMISAYHHFDQDDPHGMSLLESLPVMARIYQIMANSLGQTWERYGTPSYVLTWIPPEGFSDPQGTQTKKTVDEFASVLQQAVQSRAENTVRDVVLAGQVKVEILGAQGEAMDFSAQSRPVLEQFVAAFELPSWMLGLHWSTTERMSSVEAALLTRVIEGMRSHLAPPILRMLKLRQRMIGGDEQIKLIWDAPSLIDRKAEAEAERTEEEARAKKLENEQKLWRLGMRTPEQVARELIPELAEKTDAEVRAALPDLSELPPAAAPSPFGGGDGAGQGERGDELPRPGPFGRSLSYASKGWTNGNGRH